jgi:hypothetical protein
MEPRERAEEQYMIYRGHVQGQVIVLAGDVHLPDGLEVLVEPLDQQAAPASSADFANRNGVPVFPTKESELAPGLDLVNALRDDAP